MVVLVFKCADAVSKRKVLKFDWPEYLCCALTKSSEQFGGKFGRDHENDLTKQIHGCLFSR